MDFYKYDNFEKVNGPYNDEQIGEIEIELEFLPYDDEPEEGGEYSSSEENLEFEE